MVNEVKEANPPVDYSPAVSITAVSCGAVGHVTCPPLPQGDCAIIAIMQVIDLKPCSFLEHFGNRYWSGWFNYYEIWKFLNLHGICFSVLYNSREIELCQEPYYPKLRLSLVGDCHWSDPVLINSPKFAVAFRCILFLAKLKRLVAKSDKKIPNLTLSSYVLALVCIIRLSKRLSSKSILMKKMQQDAKASQLAKKYFFVWRNLVLYKRVKPSMYEELTPLLVSSHDSDTQVQLAPAEDIDNEDLNDSVDEKDESEVDSEEEEDDECEVHYPELDWAEEGETSCCRTPKEITQNNFNLMVLLMNQFKGHQPAYDCLFNMLFTCNIYLQMLSSMTDLSSDCIEFLRVYLHFRHNVFNYIFLRSVSGYACLFDDEKEIDVIASNRTPDFVSLTDVENSKKAVIFEFTIVANKLRANFMKGFDLKTSKYYPEIRDLQNLGYNVEYYPVAYSTGDDFETNAQSWEQQGFVLEVSAKQELFKFSSFLNSEFNYLFSLTFQVNSNRALPFGELELSKYDMKEDSWFYRAVLVRKFSYYRFKAIFFDYNFNDSSHYKFKKTKTGFMWIGTTHDEDRAGKTGFFCNRLKTDEGLFYNEFKTLISGKEEVLIKTRIREVDIGRLTDHGSKVDSLRVDHHASFYNPRMLNFITLEDSNMLDKKVMSLTMDGISFELNEADVKGSLVKYKETLELKYNSDAVGNKVIISPRRSFISFFDSRLSTEIHYTNGLQFSHLNINDCSSLFIKSVSVREKDMKYHERVTEFSEREAALKEAYKSSLGVLSKLIGGFKGKYKIALQASGDKAQDIIAAKLSMEKARRSYLKVVDQSKVTRGIRITSAEKTLFKNETVWEKNRGYKVYRGEQKDLQSIASLCKQVSDSVKFRFDLPNNEYDAPCILKMKEMCLKELSTAYHEVAVTNIFNALVFMSRLAYSLMAVSNQSFNSNYVKFDNLGLTNVILTVKGGKKITTTRRTKIFKLIYPCSDHLQEWNPSVFTSKGVYFDETPWMQITQSALFDMQAAPYKYLLNYSSLRERYTPAVCHDMIDFPALLLLHNRRKTEITLHNLRYICVNPLAKYTRLADMVKEFAGHCYSAFDHAIRYGFADHYMGYFQTIRKWSTHETNDEEVFKNSFIRHPFTGRYIHNIDDLTYVIYSTYMMSKGLFNQTIEQAGNLKSILETHQQFINANDQHDYTLAEFDKLSLDDFGFCPEVCYVVGKMLSAKLRKNNASARLNTAWNNILAEPIDSMANNHGLRDEGTDFFGSKGYYVVYKKLLDQGMEDVYAALDIEDEQKRLKALTELNETFLSVQTDIPLCKVIMHVVDKVQRGGPREIYVMDYNTKAYQYPIEKLFKLICEFIGNELISVPSARRAGLIHRKCFEYRSADYETYYLTLDCRKWAPRSNPDKYLYMILGMQDVLPRDFVLSVFNYFHVHRSKEIHTRSEVYKVFASNPMNVELAKLMIEDEEKKSHKFNMPYSFVMGIFNMLSSLLHAGGQIYAKQQIEYDMAVQNLRCNLDMFAHSDDSGGRLSIQRSESTDKLVTRILQNYEVIMKGLNHLMSHKKCAVGKVYFELVSILYMNHELLPLLPKFYSNISLTFSGQGLSSDMKQVVSKSIELQMNGATASQAYKSQIICSNMYRNFYRVNIDTQLPAMGGFANTWPTFYLSHGAGVDEARICIYNNIFYRQLMTAASEYLDFDLTDGTVRLKYCNVIRSPVAYRKFQNKIKLPDFKDNEWFFGSNKTRHSRLNLLWFKSKMNSADFATALLNINEVKRAYDSLYMSTGEHITLKTGLTSINQFLLKVVQSNPTKTPIEKVLRVMFQSFMKFYTFIEELGNVRFTSKSGYTIKPSTIQVNDFVESPIGEYNSLHLAASICRPELLKYTYSNKRYGTELETMSTFLQNIGVPFDLQLIKNFLDFMKKSTNTVKNFYCALPAKSRAGSSYNGIYHLFLNNFHSTKQMSTSQTYYYDKGSVQHEVPEKIKKCIVIYYFYIIAARCRDDVLADMLVSKDIDPEGLTRVSNIYERMKLINPAPETWQFIDLLTSIEPKKINLSTFTQWAYWVGKQARIGDEWVGNGTFDISLDHHIMRIHVKNRDIIEVEHKENIPFNFSNNAQVYFDLLLQKYNLQYLRAVTPKEGDIYFGVSMSGDLGYHTGNNIALGIQQTRMSSNLDLSIHNLLTMHNYHSGEHYIEFDHVNRKLTTFDSLVFHENKANLFKCIDWEEVPFSAKDRFFGILTSGDYGGVEDFNYKKDEIIDNFLTTDLYKLFYSCKQKKININDFIWSDIVNKMEYDEDIFPTMYENLGLKELEGILPKSRKDNLALYLYYDTMNEDLMKLRAKISTADTDEAKKLLISLTSQLKDNTGIVTLPEIGDPKEFELFNAKDTPNYILVDYYTLIISACYQGYRKMKDVQKIKIWELTKKTFQNLDQFLYYFWEPYMSGETSHLTSYKAVTIKQGILHKIIEFIHADRVAFTEFAIYFRKTSLKNFPRHPIYEDDWQILTAKLHIAFEQYGLNDDNVLRTPSNCIRNYKFESLESSEDIRYVDRSAPALCALNPLLCFQMSFTPEEELNLSAWELIQNDLGGFNFSREDVQQSKVSLQDYLEDEEIKMVIKKKNKSDKVFLCKTSNQLASLCNSPTGRQNIAIACRYIIPFLPCKTLYLKGPRGVEIYFAYNYSLKGSYTSDMPRIIKDLAKFDRYYQTQAFEMPHDHRLRMLDTTFTLDLSAPPRLELIEKNYNIESSDTYNDELIVWLTKEFNLPETVVKDLKAICSSNKAATVKFRNIKQLINEHSKNQEDKEGSLDAMIKKVFKSTKVADVSLEVKKMKLDMNISTKNPTRIIERATTYKREYKQGNSLLNGKWGLLITESLIMTQVNKDFMIGSLKMLSKNLRSIARKNEASVCSVIIDMISGAAVGISDTQTKIFEEEIKDLINKMMCIVNEAEEREEELYPPEYSGSGLNMYNFSWRLG
jgi:hypothetical protein